MPRTATAAVTKLEEYLEVSKEHYDACVDCIDHDLHIAGTSVKLRFHYLRFDENGVPKFRDLAKCLADHLVEYSFSSRRRGRPRKPNEWSRLRREARDLLRQCSKSGEAGEMLLYFLQEAVLRAPQMVAKIDLKTNPKLESNGSDGIHMRWNDADNCLDIYHGESKLEQTVSKALTNAFKSMKKFYTDRINEHELKMVTSHYKWADGKLKDAVLRYVDRTKPGGDCRVNHACLIGYDWKLYKKLTDLEAVAAREAFVKAYAARAPRLQQLLASRFKQFKLKQLRFDFFFLPFASVQDFRNAFDEALR